MLIPDNGPLMAEHDWSYTTSTIVKKKSPGKIIRDFDQTFFNYQTLF